MNDTKVGFFRILQRNNHLVQSIHEDRPHRLGRTPHILAPMEDVTDPAFRLMCKKFGADMVYTEFVSADALIRSVSKTEQKLNISDEERPVAIQIYGKDTETMVEAARIVEEARPDILDINFGCPVKRVAGKGAGAGMLQNIPKMLEITRAVVDAVKIPVTVKPAWAGMRTTRLSWNWQSNYRIVALPHSPYTAVPVHKCIPVRLTGHLSVK